MENKYHVADNRISEHADSVEGDNVVNPMGCAPNSSGSVAEECTESGEVMKSQEFAGSLPNEIYVYREDVVRCSKYEGLLGVVMEVAGDSDSEGSTIDDSDSEDKEDESGDGSNEDDNDNSGGTDKDDSLPDDSCEDDSLPDGSEEEDSLPDGHVRVKWIDGSETTENHSNITVVDRMLLHGNIVASASDPTGQMGLVVDVNITVDLLAANGEVIQDISSRNLKQVRDFSVGDCVIFKSWIGRVDDIIDNVTVLFDDGSACKVVKADPLRLKSVSKTAIDDESCPYYPGQRVRAISSSVFRSSKWLSGVWKANRLEGTVIKVEAESVVVDWIATAYLGAATNSSATAPSEEQNPKNLALLSWYLHANWQLGDWCLLPSHPLLSSSSADEPSTTSNLKEPSEGCMSLIGDSKDRLNGNFQSQSSDSVDLERMTYLDGSSRHELHNASPEYGSCSTSLSLSEEPVHESCPLHSKKLHKVLHKKDKKARRRVETFEKALYIVSSRTKVNVVWQDGTREFGLDATSLLSIRNPCDHDFFPQQYVVDKASNEGDDYSEIKRMGVVRSVNAKERTACVRWLKPVSRPEDAWEFDNEEVVSAYELDLHPDYDYCYGDLVVRLPPVSVSADVASFGSPIEELEQQADPAEVEGDASRKHSEYSKADQTSKKFSCLSWVGNITGLQDGEIEDTWADGAVSEVGPQAVYVVDLEDEESSDCESEVSDTGASWATVDENETDELENTGKEADFQIPDDDIVGRKRCTASPEVNSRQNRPLSVLLAAPGFFITLARKLFYRVREHLDLLRSYDRVINVAGSEKNIKNTEKETINNELTSQESNALGFLTAQTAHGISEECRHIAVTEDAEVTMNDTLDNLVSIDINADTKGAYSNDDPCSFKHFDSSENPLDHHFLGWSGENTGGRKWVKKVQQEWSILEKNLPDAIYVRVFEDRMDLLRAAIVGACGTPYEDGLFFFDFYLTPEFPRVPPSAYYHSGGLRINPNLYVDGKVCLSLLNTWDGKGNEVWDSSSSSILQVLVSLQGLVLNSKPYFNEAGYDKQVGTVEGEKNSLSYNENAYLLNLRSMLYVLRRPPMHFEAFVKDHFRRRGHFILKACDAYMKNCLIGSLTKDSCMDDKNREHLCSVGFKLILAKIMPRLISTFSGVGVECHQFKHLQKC